MDFDRARGAGRGAAIESVGAAVGVVTETLPQALYRVKLDEGATIVAHIADRMDRNFIRILVGDRVRVELSRDITRGRILQKI